MRPFMSAPLTLYNSLTRSIEPFAPIDPDQGVRVYSCGPTVYSDPHLGNLRAYVFTDTLTRALRWQGYDVTHVINITDVGHLTSDADAGDDKMEAAARKTRQSAWDIAAHYTGVFKRNLADLNVREPSRWSVATDHIAEMIDFATRIAPGHCYQLDSGLYFDSTTVPDYGRLARSSDDAGEARIDPVAGKRHPQDFAIWRTTPPGETRQMEWDSPWGRGAPGWHLECSVMSHKYLGSPFDIHTGGIDHREIHHVNEIAQNQAYCGCTDTGARFWMHNNFLVDRAGKMSKSKGGIATLDALVALGVHPLAYRLMCLSAHYRSELEFSGDNLLAALTRLKRLVMAVEKLRREATDPVAKLREERIGADWNTFDNAQATSASVLSSRFKQLNDQIIEDLATPAFLSIFQANLFDRSLEVDERLELVARCDAIHGLDLLDLNPADLRIRPADAQIDEAEIEARLTARREARATKDFAKSDTIRDELAAAGVEVMDGDPLGWDWKLTL